MFPQTSAVTAAALLFSVASAQSDRGYHYVDIAVQGAAYGGGFMDLYHADLFMEANQHPNSTRSVNFTPFYLGEDGFGSGSPVNTTQGSNVWTWRVNVTDFAVPDAVREYPGEQAPYQNPHVTNTAWDLSWPEGGNFSTGLQGSTGPVCMTVLGYDRLAPNVTNLYTDDNTSGDCTPILGQECITAMLAASAPRDSDCRSPGTIWTSLPECASSLGASAPYQRYGFTQGSTNLNRKPGVNGTGWEGGNDTLAVVQKYSPFASNSTSGSGIYSSSTEAYNATNTTLYDQATTKMQILLLSFVPGISGQVNQVAVCMRVNASRLPTSTSDDGASPTSDSSSQTSSPGAASANAVISMGSVVGLAGLSVMFGLL